MSQITTLTFFKYSGFSNKLWAFFMMQFAHNSLKSVKGLQFYKLMGSGKAGFNPLPDWSVYGVLQIWDSEANAKEFFTTSSLMKKYREKSLEQWSVYMKSITAKGQWSGRNPFKKSNTIDQENPFVAVVTRATIKPKHFFKF